MLSAAVTSKIHPACWQARLWCCSLLCACYATVGGHTALHVQQMSPAAGSGCVLPLREWAALDLLGRLRRLSAPSAPPAPAAAAPAPPPDAAAQRGALAVVLRRAPAGERAAAAAALLAERAAGEPDLAWCRALVAAEARQLQACSAQNYAWNFMHLLAFAICRRKANLEAANTKIHAHGDRQSRARQVFESPAALAEAAAAAALACGADVDAAAATVMLSSAEAALAPEDGTPAPGEGGGEEAGWSAGALERVQARKAAAHALEQARLILLGGVRRQGGWHCCWHLDLCP